MPRRVLPIVCAAVAMFVAIPALAQAPAQGRPGGARGERAGGPPQAPPMIKMVKPGVYMVTGIGGNTTVRVDPQGLIVVDTKNLGQANYDALMAQIRTVSSAPVKYVFITHHHQDHSGNIGPFQNAGAQVIAHENLNRNLDTYAPPQGKPEKAKITYTKDKKVRVGRATAVAHHFGNAHTGGDSVVYFPDVKVVSTGDEFVAITPNVDFPFGGSAVQWVKVLDQVLKLDFDTAIPGHGNDPMTKADVKAFRDKMNTVVERAHDLVQMGTPKDQLLAKIKTDDIGWNVTGPQWSQPARLDAFYAELQAMK